MPKTSGTILASWNIPEFEKYDRSIYPELSLFLEDVLPVHKFTQDKTLRFKVPSKKEKKFDYVVRVWVEVAE